MQRSAPFAAGCAARSARIPQVSRFAAGIVGGFAMHSSAEARCRRARRYSRRVEGPTARLSDLSSSVLRVTPAVGGGSVSTHQTHPRGRMTARIEDTGTGGDDAATGAPTAGQTTASPTAAASAAKPARPGTVSIRISTVIRGAVIAVLVVAVCVLSGLLWSARHDITQRNDHAADDGKPSRSPPNTRSARQRSTIRTSMPGSRSWRRIPRRSWLTSSRRQGPNSNRFWCR